MTQRARALGAFRRPALSRIKRAVLAWYAEVRSVRELPWRETNDPYAIWVSETMLQQTRAATAIPYWERFLRELPTVHTLAEAPQERVLALWSGLGYYRRARMLHAAAQRVVSAHGGELPRDLESLRNLDGVGSYTAGAIASIAFKQRVAAVDGNVTRVLSRLFAIDDPRCAGRARIRAVADAFAAIDEGDPGDWTQALMELGALVCTPRQPRCASCPARAPCEAGSRGAAFAAALPAKAGKPGKAGKRGYGGKRDKLTVHLVALVLTTKAGVVLARRPAAAPRDPRKDGGKGAELYAGLWETPLASDSDGSVEALASGLGVDLGELRLRDMGSVVHVLSHRRLVVKVLRGSLKGAHPVTSLGRTTRTTPATAAPYYEAPYEDVELVPYKGLPTRAHATLTRKVLDMAKVCPKPLF